MSDDDDRPEGGSRDAGRCHCGRTLPAVTTHEDGYEDDPHECPACGREWRRRRCSMTSWDGKTWYLHDGEGPARDGEASARLQPKGTDYCADIRCECGYRGHVDSNGLREFLCPDCGAVYRVGVELEVERDETAGEMSRRSASHVMPPS